MNGGVCTGVARRLLSPGPRGRRALHRGQITRVRRCLTDTRPSTIIGTRTALRTNAARPKTLVNLVRLNTLRGLAVHRVQGTLSTNSVTSRAVRSVTTRH